jgi:hypothetical protein
VYVALHAIMVVQDGNPDTMPPVVTAAAALGIYANIPAGATPASVPALAAWLLGATAVDDVTYGLGRLSGRD